MSFCNWIEIIMIFTQLIFYKSVNGLNLMNDHVYYTKMINIIKDLGPLFIKFLQILASRPRIKSHFHPILYKKLCDLQDQCYPDRRRLMNGIDYISMDPIASGTICQVYLCKYRDKKKVVKIVHRNIRDQILSSVKNLKIIKSIMNVFWYKGYKIMNSIDLDKFTQFVLKQTKMKYEVENIYQFKEMFKNYDMVIIPDIYKYTEDYYIMSYHSGLKLNDFIEKYPDFKDEAISLFYCCIYHMINNKIIHGDMHTGNFLFILSKRSVKIIILDYGIVCKLDNIESKYLLKILNQKSSKNEIINNTESLFLKINESENGKKVILDTCNKHRLNNNLNTNDILDLVGNENLVLPPRFISLFTTLQIFYLMKKDCLKSNKMFTKILIGYGIDNDFL